MALLEWGLTPEYINRRWTEELLALMFLSRTRRIKRTAEAMNRKPSEHSAGVFGGDYEMMPDTELFKKIGFEPKVVRRAN